VVTDRLFTGQRQIADVGIYHYGARFREATNLILARR
jgi:hypothetical protein